ncbi:hypothetical protein F542_6190 [Bibersteinia trehalosi USDA-ARS-USMARC-188]|uniref:Uncharacterized protein n=2 Tax=Bibersteinia trehalosi TaxID=47735 RepID=A0A4V7I8I8_BIBTR|nr:hypothetical protein F542_6190 [Bibersteinia trehalosi USDA-ARS-USMARC-188]
MPNWFEAAMAAFYFANFSQKLTAYIIRAYWCFKRGCGFGKNSPSPLGGIFNRQRHFI